MFRRSASAPDPNEEPTAGAQARSALSVITTFAAAVAIAWLLQALIVKPYRIPSPSMVPTLSIGERVLVDRVGQRFYKPRRGDILVFHPPVTAPSGQCADPTHGPAMNTACDKAADKPLGQPYIKRLIGLPGETLAVRQGVVFINGRPLREPYSMRCPARFQVCNLPEPIKIPAGRYFMMGDNRPSSDDSRYWGPIPSSWVIGRAFFSYWPPKKVGTL